MTRKTKIVATVSPSAVENGLLEKLFKAEVNVFRLNFSHGSYDEFRSLIRAIKQLREEADRPVAILQDLSGPEIRIGSFAEGVVELQIGNSFTLSVDPKVVGNAGLVYVNHKSLPKEVKKGDRIVVDDGRIALSVVSVTKKEVKCLIERGGKIRGGRGVAVPGRHLSLPALTAKDKKDVAFGLEQGVDFIAMSFVRTVQDVKTLRRFIARKQLEVEPDLIAKIETWEAVDNFDEILEAVDGVMVARGDLAVEVPPERVPLIQKEIIRKSNRAGKPVITATQMLESMIHSPIATRAEVSDVANAILDGTDAVMLSAETAVGEYPLESVNVMVQTALQIEKNYPERERINGGKSGQIEVVDSVTSSVVSTANDVGAELIIALTDSGFTGRMISRHKPKALVIAMATSQPACYKLALSFGCLPVMVNKLKTLDQAFSVIREYVLANHLAKVGDKVVVSAGAPFGQADAKTNTMFVEVI